MAGNLHVRNLDDDLIARLKRRAAARWHGRSTQAEHREISSAMPFSATLNLPSTR